MPLFDFRCLDPKCANVEEHYAKVDERKSVCSVCGGESTRLITSRYAIHADYASKDFVTSDITGSEVRITSRKQMRKLCKEFGVSPKEGPPRNDTKHFREEMRDRQMRQKRRVYV